MSGQSCDQIHAKSEDGQRDQRIRINHTVIKKLTYRFESSSCQCMQQPALDHCSLSYSRPDQQKCVLSEMSSILSTASNCEALEMCKQMGESQCDGVYHDGGKYYMVKCRQQLDQRVATVPGLAAEYIIQMRNCF